MHKLLFILAAANGVILVTTKTGKKNSKGKISFNTYTGFQETARTLPTLNATNMLYCLMKVMPMEESASLPKRK
jgi:hypothetical protein